MINRDRLLLALQANIRVTAVSLAWLTMIAPSAFVSAEEDFRQKVEGTWYGILDARSIGGVQRLSVVAALTRDGRVVALNHGDLTPGLGLATSALGSWVRTGPDGLPQFEIVGNPLTDAPRLTLGPFATEFQRLRVQEEKEEDD